MALVLTRKVDQILYLDTQEGRISIIVTRIQRDRVSMAIIAPNSIFITR